MYIAKYKFIYLYILILTERILFAFNFLHSISAFDSKNKVFFFQSKFQRQTSSIGKNQNKKNKGTIYR